MYWRLEKARVQEGYVLMSEISGWKLFGHYFVYIIEVSETNTECRLKQLAFGDNFYLSSEGNMLMK